MKGAAVILALLATPLGICAESDAASASRVAAQVEEKYAGLDDLRAEFLQESRVATLGRTRIKKGKIAFGKGGKMRWEYAPPDPQLIVSDGEQLWYYRPERRQVVVQELGSAFTTQTPLLFLFGEGRLEGEFSWEESDLSPDDSGSLVLELKPLRESPDLVALTLEVRPEDYSVAATVLRDAFGNVTRLEFSGEVENSGLDEGLFVFEIPDGVEVIRP